MALDKFDLAILSVLQQDSRASLQEISEKVALSPTPCWNRIKRMESDGIIQGYSVRINQIEVGFAETVLVQVTLDNHSDQILFEFGRTLAEIPEVIEAFLISGDYDYLIRIAVRDTRDYERLLREKLYKIPGIRHTKSSFVLRYLKESALPLGIAPVSSARGKKESAAKE
ncbi:MAG: Lrp/AsnC family transcriptional regulator [Gammaproteobacteria bacterium]|nr:Lrp/AsnC family transcriptional regulator [Gammaproteobacteria bacterium]MBI5619038.1 Lrp/AsnC family transcriptional regulator [Gammaproteobacteria bacterium]